MSSNDLLIGRVSKDLVVKIADFGLARDIYTNDYYRTSDKHKAVPVKWMAIESLDKGIYSSKSDVVSTLRATII